MIMGDVMVCNRGAVVFVDGCRVRLHRNRHTAHADSRIVTENPDLWREMPVDFPSDWQPPRKSDEPEVEPDDVEGDGPTRPTTRDDRATWDTYAAGLGLNPEVVAELPNKGEVIALVDQLESGAVVIDGDGQLVTPPAPES